MMVKTLPPSSRTSQEDSRGGELSVIEVIAEQSTQKVIKSAEASQQPRHKARVMAGLEPETVLYDPVEIETQYNGRFLQVIRRIFTVLKPILAFILGLWLDKRWGTLVKNERRRAVQLRDLLTKLGPAYIKIGQALSTRPDLVPPIYLEELTRLQDQLPAFPNEIAYQFIEEELGAPPSEIYAELSSQPIAAASLGQVYQGRLKTGEEVAIKVQRPDLRERITIDLYILRKLAAWVQRNVKLVRSDLVGILD